MRYDTFKSKLLPRKMGFQKQICIILTRKKNRRERHEWLHRKAAAAKMSIFPSIKWILFDGLFSGQSGHSSKELLCLKNLVHAHSIFDDTSNEKRPKMKNPPQIQTQIQISIFQNIALALGGSITFRERALPSLGFWRLLSSPQNPKLSASNPRNRDSGFSPNPYYLCIWSPMNRDS